MIYLYPDDTTVTDLVLMQMERNFWIGVLCLFTLTIFAIEFALC